VNRIDHETEQRRGPTRAAEPFKKKKKKKIILINYYFRG
jgi:hypothetical protein